MVICKFYFILLLNLQIIITDYITYPLIKIKNKPLNDEIKSYIFSEIFDTYYLIRINISNNKQADCIIIGEDIDLLINETVNDYYIKSSSTFQKI